MRILKFTTLLCACALTLSLSACRKAPEGEAQNKASVPGSVSPAPAGQPGAPGQPPAATPAKPVPAQLPAVVARVNGEDVKKEEFERMLKTMESQAGQAIPAERRDEIVRGALDQMITYVVLRQESKTRGIKVDDAEIEAKMGQLKSQFPNEEAFQKALKDRGMTADSLRGDARVDLSVNKLMEVEVATVAGPSEADAKAFYDKNPTEFQVKESVRASHILIRVDEKADDATKKKAKAEIDEVLKKVKAGGDFAKLAQEHSQDGSAAQGGDLNYFGKGDMVPEFDKVAFELKPGQTSDVVKTNFGYHIIKVVDHKPGRAVPFEEAQVKIKEFLGQQKKKEHASSFIEALKKKSKIEVLI
jgi:peptidyl-prolyl cis-trans isomerase C